MYGGFALLDHSLLASHICTETYTKQFVRLFHDVVTIIEKRFVSLFDIIRKLYK